MRLAALLCAPLSQRRGSQAAVDFSAAAAGPGRPRAAWGRGATLLWMLLHALTSAWLLLVHWLLPGPLARTTLGGRLRLLGRNVLARARGFQPARFAIESRTVTMTTSKGVRLEGTLYSPCGHLAASAGPLPAVLMRTPYGRNFVRREAEVFAERGYHCLVQDTRGRFGSAGEFFPVANEVEDGAEAARWLRAQRWCSGKVGAFGISYLGLAAWAAAAGDDARSDVGGDVGERGERGGGERGGGARGGGARGATLDAVVAVMASSRLFPVFIGSGGAIAFDLGLRWLHIVLNLQRVVPKHSVLLDALRKACNGVRFMARVFGPSPELDRALYHVPVREADALVTEARAPVECYQQGLRELHPNCKFWREKDRLFDLCGERRPPAALIIGGWHDFFLEQQLDDYAHAAARDDLDSSSLRLSIGPYSHWDVPFYLDPALRRTLRWFETHLCADKGAAAPSNGGGATAARELFGAATVMQNGVGTAPTGFAPTHPLPTPYPAIGLPSAIGDPRTHKPVQLFVMGVRERHLQWRFFDSWPPLAAEPPSPLYLSAGARLSMTPPVVSATAVSATAGVSCAAQVEGGRGGVGGALHAALRRCTSAGGGVHTSAGGGGWSAVGGAIRSRGGASPRNSTTRSIWWPHSTLCEKSRRTPSPRWTLFSPCLRWPPVRTTPSVSGGSLRACATSREGSQDAPRPLPPPWPRACPTGARRPRATDTRTSRALQHPPSAARASHLAIAARSVRMPSSAAPTCSCTPRLRSPPRSR